jgi:hypothetical protein
MSKLAYSVGAANAILAVLVLLGVLDLTVDQLAGIGAALNAVAIAVAAWLDPNIPIGNAGGE